MPQLGDPNFRRAVVLVLEHEEGGAMGIVVNHPSSLTLEEVAEGQKLVLHPERKRSLAFVGGPVEPERGFLLHQRADLPEAMLVCEGLYVSGSVQSLKLLFEDPKERFRLCLGYSGWGPGQLDRELVEGSWLTAPIDVEEVLGVPPHDAWAAALRKMGIEPSMLIMGGGIQ